MFTCKGRYGSLAADQELVGPTRLCGRMGLQDGKTHGRVQIDIRRMWMESERLMMHL